MALSKIRTEMWWWRKYPKNCWMRVIINGRYHYRKGGMGCFAGYVWDGNTFKCYFRRQIGNGAVHRNNYPREWCDNKIKLHSDQLKRFMEVVKNAKDSPSDCR